MLLGGMGAWSSELPVSTVCDCPACPAGAENRWGSPRQCGMIGWEGSAAISCGIDRGWSDVDLMKGGERHKFDYAPHCGQTADHCLTKSAMKLRLCATVAALRGRLDA